MRTKSFVKWLAVIMLPVVAVLGSAFIYDIALIKTEQECRNYSLTPQMRIKACKAAIKISLPLPTQLAELYNQLGYVYKDLGQTEQANEVFVKATKLYPPAWHVHLSQAENYQNNGKYDQAAEAYSRALTPNSILLANMYWGRANAHDSNGELPQALTDYTTAIDLTPYKAMRAKYQIDRGTLYARNPATWDLAIADFNAAIESNRSVGSNSNLADAYIERGRIEYLKADYDAALLDFLHTQDSDDQKGKGYGLLWLYLAELGSGKDATTDLRNRITQYDVKQWPGPIIQVMLGDIKPEDIIIPAYPATWPRERQEAAAHCELAYYLGEVSLIKKDNIEASKQFQSAIDSGVKDYTEYWLATYELSHLNGTQAQSQN